MRRKTVVIIASIFLIAIATVGVGYGLWFEILTVTGRATTGEVDVTLSVHPVESWVTNDADPPEVVWVDSDGIPWLDDGSTRLYNPDKDVVFCGVEGEQVTPQVNVGNTQDDGINKLVITVDNAYPGYHCWVPFNVMNIGTIPTHMLEPQIAPDLPGAVYNQDGDYRYAQMLDCYNTGFGPLDEMEFLQPPYQLHPGDEVFCAVLVHFANEDGLDENAGDDSTNAFTPDCTTGECGDAREPYTFEWTIKVCQWNEDSACGIVPPE